MPDPPATDWETQALPIGNGPLAAKVFGGVATEQLQFNGRTDLLPAPRRSAEHAIP
ncbi:glycoside hydrolase N-terminal domain-containing protein [Nonomuraea montanisoli]|nr:glycoside hydrolase N-terminal domain-containing protein [Nonomuraea montanisoli]